MGQNPADSGEGSGGGDYEIIISISQSKGMSVSVEPMEAEEATPTPGGSAAAPGDASEGPEDGEAGQPVENIREAVKLVLDIYANAGQMQDTSGDEAAMSEGYGSSK